MNKSSIEKEELLLEHEGNGCKSVSVTSPSRKKTSNECKMITKIAIGVSSFKELVEESTIFIDKTLFIKEFLESPIEVLLITCPRRWGKSINMDMLKTFLEIEIDKDGNKIEDKTKTYSYKLFQGENLEKPLNIAQNQEFSRNYDRYQGEWPVISVDFKNVKGNNYQEIVDELKIAIRNVFSEHNYLYRSFLKRDITNYCQINDSSICLQKEDTEYLEMLINLKNLPQSEKSLFFKKINSGKEATNIDIENSLMFLSELLYNHYGKRVYILLDEYDTPINNILQSKGFSEEDLEKTLMLFRNLMGTTFKGNKYLEKGLITGILRIAKSSFFSDANNIIEYNFLNNEFARYYGFTEDDICHLFDEYKIENNDRHKAQSWYDGYRVSIDQTLKIYNPWSIVNFLKRRKIANYWEETGSIDFFKSLFKINAIITKFQSLLKNEETCVQLGDLKFSKDNFITLKDLLNAGDNYKIEPATVDIFFSFIFAAGYLTLCEKQKNNSTTSIRLPNCEVKSEIEKKLLSFYKQVYKLESRLFNDATNALDLLLSDSGKNTESFKCSLETLFKEFPKFINVKQDIEVNGAHGNEDLIHSVINYVALQIKSSSKFGSEVCYKNKLRADIILINDDTQSGMIIEIKFDKTAKEALVQALNYSILFEKHTYIKNIKYLGINVSKDKVVDIECKQEKNSYYLNENGQ